MPRWRQTLEQFKHMFPEMAKGVSSVHQEDKNGYEISMDTTAHVTLYFSYHSVDRWTLQTARDRNNP